jgi:hypothetical protein
VTTTTEIEHVGECHHCGQTVLWQGNARPEDGDANTICTDCTT